MGWLGKDKDQIAVPHHRPAYNPCIFPDSLFKND